MKRETMRLIAAVLLAPTITVFLLFFLIIPLLSIPSLGPLLDDIMLVFVMIGVLFTLVYGVPVSAFLRYMKLDGYQYYAIAGIVPATVWVLYMEAAGELEYLSSGSFIWMAGGIISAILFRWVRGSVDKDRSHSSGHNSHFY